jgi:predicted Zn finger-like uncharacterized protein
MKFRCEKCGTRYTIADEKVRHKVLKIRCKVCEHVIQVSDPELGAVPGPAQGAHASPSRPATLSAVPALAPRSPMLPQASSLRGPSGATSVADPLAQADDVEWYAAPEGGQQGPMPLERLVDLCRQGAVKGEDFVWNEGMADWRPANAVPELDLVFRPKPVVKPPPMPPARPAPPPIPPPPAAAPRATVAPVQPTAPPEADDEDVGDEPTAFGLPTMSQEALPEKLDLDLLAGPAASTTTPPSDELSTLMDAELGAQPTALAPALSGASAPPAAFGDEVDDFFSGPARKSTASSAPAAVPLEADPTRVRPPVDDTLHAVATSLPGGTSASPTGSATAVGLPPVHTGPQVVVTPARSRGLPPWIWMAAAGLVLVGGGVGLGIALAPSGGGDPVAAQQTPPTLAPPTVALVSTAPSAATPAPPTVSPSAIAALASVPAPTTVAAVKLPTPAVDREDPRPGRKVDDARPPASTSEAPKPSAFAGLDAARGSSAPSAPASRVATGRGDLPDSLSQAEITSVLKRNQKALQGCYMRQLKRDESLANGRATLRFRIHGNGHPRDVGLEKRFDGTVLQQCLVSVVERWVFPEFDGDPIPVEFPLIFQASM